ncbi:MAG: acyl-CoA dehydrogenase family protein, partial [Dehalococcoidia bacterium]|nr:acyl-CoA dehydrogenase family protein [Dehalococcoidia bacterium]
MNFRFDAAQEAFYQEVDSFIRRELPSGWVESSHHWPGGYGTIPEFEELNPAAEEFRRKLGEKGWLTISWPKEYGGAGRSHIEQAIFHERLSYYRAPGPGIATLIVGPTILNFGGEESKREWLPKIARENTRSVSYTHLRA